MIIPGASRRQDPAYDQLRFSISIPRSLYCDLEAISDLRKTANRFDPNRTSCCNGCHWNFDAILLPAVQMVREAGRRTVCSNNVRQLALGVMNYESSHGQLPIGLRSFENVTGNSSAAFLELPSRRSQFRAGRRFGADGSVHDRFIGFGGAGNLRRRRNGKPRFLDEKDRG